MQTDDNLRGAPLGRALRAMAEEARAAAVLAEQRGEEALAVLQEIRESAFSCSHGACIDAPLVERIKALTVAPI
jgi:hypothetical protein